MHSEQMCRRQTFILKMCVSLQPWRITKRQESLTTPTISEKGWSEHRNCSKSLVRGTITRSSVSAGNQSDRCCSKPCLLPLEWQQTLTDRADHAIQLCPSLPFPGMQISRRSSRRTGSWHSSGTLTTSSPRLRRKKPKRSLSTLLRLKRSSPTQVRRSLLLCVIIIIIICIIALCFRNTADTYCEWLSTKCMTLLILALALFMAACKITVLSHVCTAHSIFKGRVTHLWKFAHSLSGES